MSSADVIDDIISRIREPSLSDASLRLAEIRRVLEGKP